MNTEDSTPGPSKSAIVQSVQPIDKKPDAFPSLKDLPVMKKFHAKFDKQKLAMQSAHAREEIQNKIRRKVDERIERQMEDMRYSMKRRFLDKLAEYGYFNETVDTGSQTVEVFETLYRPSSEFILTSEANEIIHLDISSTDWSPSHEQLQDEAASLPSRPKNRKYPSK